MFEALVCVQEQQVGIDTLRKKLIVFILTLSWRERIEQNRDSSLSLFCRCFARVIIFVVELVSLVPYQIDNRNVCLTCNPLYKNSSTARFRRLLLPAMLVRHWSRRTDTGHERIVLTRRLQLPLNPVVGQDPLLLAFQAEVG